MAAWDGPGHHVSTTVSPFSAQLSSILYHEGHPVHTVCPCKFHSNSPQIASPWLPLRPKDMYVGGTVNLWEIKPRKSTKIMPMKIITKPFIFPENSSTPSHPWTWPDGLNSCRKWYSWKKTWEYLCLKGWKARLRAGASLAQALWAVLVLYLPECICSTLS